MTVLSSVYGLEANLLVRLPVGGRVLEQGIQLFVGGVVTEEVGEVGSYWVLEFSVMCWGWHESS